MGVTISAIEFRAIGRGVAFFGIGRGAEDRDDVEQFTLAQRIMHNVEAWSRPKHDFVAMHVRAHVLHGDNRAMRHISDRVRLTFAEHLRAHGRAQTVGAIRRALMV